MKRSPIRKISEKKKAQLKAEALLSAKLLVKQGGRCDECGCVLRWGSAKHEIKFRSQGGNPVDENNCVLLCIHCHNARHGIKSD